MFYTSDIKYVILKKIDTIKRYGYKQKGAGMKDYSSWKEYIGTSEGSGRSEKIWLQNPDTGQTGLFKFKKDSSTTDHISECLAFQIAQLLGIPCARFELGMYYGREGSISYNIVENPKQVLIEGIYFITLLYPGYNTETLIDETTKHRYSVEMVRRSIENFVPLDGFFNMLLFDHLIGNTDRHQNNWAVILEEDHMKWSPLYDNSSSLCAYILEDQIESFLGKDKTRWKGLTDTKSRSMLRCTTLDEKRPTHLTMIQYLKENYYIETCDMAEKIIRLMTEERIRDILKSYTETELSVAKKELIARFLKSKVQMLQEVYTGKEERPYVI